MSAPSFLGIGTGRAGTRWLVQCLSEHPDIFMHPGEVYFFSPRDILSQWHRGLPWYESLFDSSLIGSSKAWGEITPAYLSDRSAPGLIAQHIPTVKLICTLREQCQHHYSFYRLFLSLNPEIYPTRFSFQQYLANNTRVLDMGFYFEHLQRYLEFFPREQLLVLLYEDLLDNPIDYIRRVFTFLGVEPDFRPPSMDRKINQRTVGDFPRTLVLNRMAERLNESGHLRLARLVERWNIRSVESENFPARHQMSADVYERIGQIYREHNEMLSELLGRDLTHWNGQS